MLEQLIDTTTTIGPDVYYALLMLGFWALITAIYQPGTGLPEGTAAIALTLSLSGLLLLPATLIGLVLLGASLLTFLALIFYRQRVWLVAVGFALSVAGGVLLFGPGMRVSVWSVGLVTILGILYHQLLLVPGLRIQGRARQRHNKTQHQLHADTKKDKPKRYVQPMPKSRVLKGSGEIPETDKF